MLRGTYPKIPSDEDITAETISILSYGPYSLTCLTNKKASNNIGRIAPSTFN